MSADAAYEEGFEHGKDGWLSPSKATVAKWWGEHASAYFDGWEVGHGESET